MLSYMPGTIMQQMPHCVRCKDGDTVKTGLEACNKFNELLADSTFDSVDHQNMLKDLVQFQSLLPSSSMAAAKKIFDNGKSKGKAGLAKLKGNKVIGKSKAAEGSKSTAKSSKDCMDEATAAALEMFSMA